VFSLGITGGELWLTGALLAPTVADGWDPVAHLSVTRRHRGCTAPGEPSRGPLFFISDFKKMILRKGFKSWKIHNLSSRSPEMVKQILLYSINVNLQFDTIACYV